MLDGACYYVSTTPSTWFTARMDCLSRGGDLVRITSHAVWSTLKTHIVARYTLQRYWIGLAGIYWYWSDGESLACSSVNRMRRASASCSNTLTLVANAIGIWYSYRASCARLLTGLSHHL